MSRWTFWRVVLVAASRPWLMTPTATRRVSPARMAMSATTTSSSTSVKPARDRLRRGIRGRSECMEEDLENGEKQPGTTHNRERQRRNSRACGKARRQRPTTSGSTTAIRDRSHWRVRLGSRGRQWVSRLPRELLRSSFVAHRPEDCPRIGGTTLAGRWPPAWAGGQPSISLAAPPPRWSSQVVQPGGPARWSSQVVRPDRPGGEQRRGGGQQRLS